MYYYSPKKEVESKNMFKQIAKVINGEFTAITCYEQLSKLATEKEVRERILEIREDELRHFKIFSQIYRSLTGRNPSPKLKTQCPTMYEPGLEFSFRDEQETVEFYLDLASSTNNPYIKEQFKRAAADEQRHAVWLLYFLSRH